MKTQLLGLASIEGRSAPSGRNLPTLLSLGLVGLVATASSAPAQCPLGEVHQVIASDANAGDRLGISVGLSGDHGIVGAYFTDDNGSEAGSAYLIQRDQGGPNAWGEVRELIGSDTTSNDCFAFAVDVSGDTAIVGAYRDDDAGNNSGAAYVFGQDTGGTDNWGEVKKLVSSDLAARDRFGFAVAIDGDTAVVGAYFDDDNGLNSGAAYVFERNLGGADNWGEAAKLVPSDGAAKDKFGWSVAIAGDEILVGAPLDDDGGRSSGSAYVFHRDLGGPGNWGEVTKLVASDDATNDRFGLAVAISGDIAVVGAPLDDDLGTDSGSVYFFERDLGGSDNWGERTKRVASDGAANANLGFSVGIDGVRAVAGSIFESTGGNRSGAAYAFERDQGGLDIWGELSKLASSDLSAGDLFGRSVCVSGSLVLVGADQSDAGGADSGSAYVFDSAQQVVTYCTAGTTSSGCNAVLSSQGFSSLSNSGPFTITTTNVEGNRNGIYFYSIAGRSATAWGNSTSFLCVKAPVQRMTPNMNSGGIAGTCNGSYSRDWNAYVAANPLKAINQALVVGSVVGAQAWYRDPPAGTGPQLSKGTALSNGLEFVLCP